jgi:hypothetical protein
MALAMATFTTVLLFAAPACAITWVVTSDLHVGAAPTGGLEALVESVFAVNSLGSEWPDHVGGGAVEALRGVVITGVG